MPTMTNRAGPKKHEPKECNSCYSNTVLHIYLVRAEHILMLRAGKIEDADEVGRIIFEAFSTIAEKHSLPPDFPSVDIGTSVASSCLSDCRIYFLNYRIVYSGQNFVDNELASVIL